MQPSLTKLTCGTSLFSSRSLRHVRFISCPTLTLKNIPGNSPVETSNQQPRKWDLYAGLCLERKPIITKEMTPLEKMYAAHLTQVETELSKKSDHEIRHEGDIILIEKLRKGEVDTGTVETAQDYELKVEQELKEFQPASRTTEADQKNDTKSLERSLDSHLLFVISQKLGDSSKWILPHIKRIEGETMRQVADRALSTYCPTVAARILGNAPWGFYKYKYPKGFKNEEGVEIYGAKVFFYKAQVLSGDVQLERDKLTSLSVDNYGWLKRAELPTYFEPEYFKAISGFLIPEY